MLAQYDTIAGVANKHTPSTDKLATTMANTDLQILHSKATKELFFIFDITGASILGGSA